MLLTPKQRLVLREHRLHGRPQKQIAAHLHISPAAVSQLVNRGEQRLQRLLGQCPGGDLRELLQALLN